MRGRGEDAALNVIILVRHNKQVIVATAVLILVRVLDRFSGIVFRVPHG